MADQDRTERGFAAMDDDKQKEIASKGGKASHQKDSSKKGDKEEYRSRTPDRDRSERGFAAMDDEKQREIASKGGKAAHEKGTAHEFNSREAKEAGREGGEKVSQDREHMSDIGKKGGQS